MNCVWERRRHKCPEREIGVHLLPQTHSRNLLCGIRKQNQEKLLQMLEKALFWFRPGALCRIIAGNYFLAALLCGTDNPAVISADNNSIKAPC